MDGDGHMGCVTRKRRRGHTAMCTGAALCGLRQAGEEEACRTKVAGVEWVRRGIENFYNAWLYLSTRWI